MNGLMEQDYNQLTLLPDIPYKIVAYILENNDLVWRLLAYNDSDAWKNDSNHPNLSKADKGLLVYDGIRTVDECRVFLTTGLDYATTNQISMLRISLYDVTPTNHILASFSIAVEVYCHFQVSTLSNYQPRDLAIIQSVIETINGVDQIGGIGRIYFDASQNPRSKITTIGNSPFKGKLALLCSQVA